MLQDLTKIYEGNNLAGATENVIFLPIVRAGTLSAVRVQTDEAQTGAAVFEVLKNGVVITGLTALTIPNAAKSGTVSGLNIALVAGDEIVLNLLSGNVSAPVTLNLVADDGTPVTAYEIAVENGFVGNETAWLASLQGADGDDGDDGADGADGEGVPIGGTTGQILAKNSNADFDTEWIDAPSGSSGETNTASNVGATGVGIFKEKTGVDLRFRKLVAGTGIAITQNTDNITIAANTTSEAYTAVVWQNKGGVTESPTGTITKTGVTDQWGDAGASSVDPVTGNGGVKYVCGADSTVRKQIGLTYVDSGYGYEDADFSFVMSETGQIQIWENGTGLYSTTWTNGTVLEIYRDGDFINYLINSVNVRSVVCLAGNLYVDASIYTSGGAFSGVQMRNTLTVAKDTYAIYIQLLSTNPLDNTTYYFGNLPRGGVSVQTVGKIIVQKAGVIKIVELNMFAGVTGTAENISMYIRVNNTTDYLIATVAAATTTRIFSNANLNIALVAGDYFEIKMVCPTWATNPTSVVVGGYVFIQK